MGYKEGIKRSLGHHPMFSLGFGAQVFVGIALISVDEKQYIGAEIMADVGSRLH